MLKDLATFIYVLDFNRILKKKEVFFIDSVKIAPDFIYIFQI